MKSLIITKLGDKFFKHFVNDTTEFFSTSDLKVSAYSGSLIFQNATLENLNLSFSVEEITIFDSEGELPHFYTSLQDLVDHLIYLGHPSFISVSLGGATEQKQDLGNGFLLDIDTAFGAQSNTTATSDGGTFSFIALFKRLLSKIPTLGNNSAANSMPAVLANHLTIVGVASQTAINANILTTDATPIDTSAYQSGLLEIVSTGTAGTYIVEQSINGSTWGPVVLYEVSAPTPITTAITATATTRQFKFDNPAPLLRVRIVSTITGGSIQVRATLSQVPFSSPILSVQQMLGTLATAWFMRITDGTNSPAIKAASTAPAIADNSLVVGISPNIFAPILVADQVSGAITTTTTSATITPTGGTTYEINIPVTVVSGTTPTLDFDIQESDDSGTNWFTVYSFPRITATGIYRSPKLTLRGNRVRYVQTITGTTPSFTRAINRLQCYDSVNTSISQLIDRSIVLTTLNSVTPSLNVQNANNAQLTVSIGAATTPPILQLEGSDDNGVTWIAIGTALTTIASSTVAIRQTGTNFQLIRARVSTIGVGVTAGYVLLKGY